MNRILDLALAAVIVIVLAILGTSAIAGTWYQPWNWNNQHHGFPRQMTNIKYIEAGGVPVGKRIPIRNEGGTGSSTNWSSPTCMDGGIDLFNPAGSTNPQDASGASISFFAGGAVHVIDVPSSKIRWVNVSSREPASVSFQYDKLPFYYDNFYDSIWQNSSADGPKSAIINCMKANSLTQRMQIGLVSVTLYLPHGGPGN